MTPNQRHVRRLRKMRQAQNGGGRGSLLGISVTSVATAFVLALVVMMGSSLGAYAYVAKDLPSPDSLSNREIARTTMMFDRNGELLYELFDPHLGRRTTVPLNEVSPYLVQATIATEDASFYENQGINIRGIARAFWSIVSTQQVLQGGSSITQQLVKNVLIPESERTELSLLRKVKEVILSLELTRRYSKDEILEYYLNEIYYGNLSYGIEAASQSYFAKSAQDLNLAEAAMLAGIPQAPAVYSPLSNPEDARWRQHSVLDLMVRQEFITEAEAEIAKAQKLEYRTTNFEIRAPHFVMYVRELLEEKYGSRTVTRGGLRITTSLDIQLQDAAQTIVQEQVAKTSQTVRGHNGALTAIDPKTGEILAMVGSADYSDPSIQGQVNVATSPRQPGSAFKPFTYVTAFQKGWNPATSIVDEPIFLQDGPNRTYQVQNFDKRYRGPVTVRDALANSMNVPAIKAIQFAGVDNVINTAHHMGITTLNQEGWYGPALTLGGGEVKLLDLTYAYGVFANQGVMAGARVPTEKQQAGHRTVDPVAVLRVEDSSGKVLEEFQQAAEQVVLPPEYAYLISHILSDNAARQPVFGQSLRLPGGRPAAVKTGTTEYLNDFWTVGYTPELVVGTWIGNSDNSSLTGGTSGSTTGPLWERFMALALADKPVSQFPRPGGIITATVCLPSGKLAGPVCPSPRTEVFVKGQAPTQMDNTYTSVKIDRTTGLPATERTPAENIEEKTFIRGQEPPTPTPTPPVQRIPLPPVPAITTTPVVVQPTPTATPQPRPGNGRAP